MTGALALVDITSEYKASVILLKDYCSGTFHLLNSLVRLITDGIPREKRSLLRA
jgi:hypothetical protein